MLLVVKYDPYYCCNNHVMIDSQYCSSTLGSVNPAGDTLRSIADSLGLSDVLKYLESLGADSKGESVLLVSYCDDVMIIGVSSQPSSYYSAYYCIHVCSPLFRGK